MDCGLLAPPLRPLESETDAVFCPFSCLFSVREQTPPSTCEEAWSRPLGGFREGRGEGGAAVSPVSAGETGGEEEAGWSHGIKTSLTREDEPPPRRRSKVSKVTNLSWNFWH